MLLIFISILCVISYMMSSNPSIIDTSLFPEFMSLTNSINIIKNELYGCMTTRLWTFVDHNNIEQSIIHKEMLTSDVRSYAASNNSALNNGIPSIKVFLITINKDQILANSFYCKETFKLLNNIPNVINAMFVCIEPGIRIPKHTGNVHNVLKCVIPLIIPNGDCGISIDNKDIKFSEISKNNDFMIYDELYSNYMWNNSDSNLFLLFIEILK